MTTSVRCSELSLSSGEPLFGTAKYVGIWVLIETPNAWRKFALAPPIIPEEVSAHLSGLAALGGPVRCLAVRQIAKNRQTRRCFIAVSGGTNPTLYSMKITDYRELLSLDIGRAVAGLDPRVAREAGSLYAVCAHGSHDRCCGTYGGRTYAVARSMGVQALQSSHVGGCRFAPNVLCLPHGLLYGRVSGEEIPALIRCHESGRIHLDRYRGRTCYPKPAQAAEFFLRKETGILGYRDIACLACTETRPGRWLTRFRSLTGEEFEVVHQRAGEPLLVLHKCGSTEPRQHHQYECLAVRRIPAGADAPSASPVSAGVSRSC